MYTTISLTAGAKTPTEEDNAIQAMHEAAGVLLRKGLSNFVMSKNSFDDLEKEEPDYEKLYFELVDDVNRLASAWEDSKPAYKQRLADELRQFTGVDRVE